MTRPCKLSQQRFMSINLKEVMKLQLQKAVWPFCSQVMIECIKNGEITE